MKNKNMDGLKVYKISKNNYEVTKGSKLFSYMWNPDKYKIYNFKKLGGISGEYIQKGILLKKPHIQMILQIQNRINEKINETMKHIKLFEGYDDVEYDRRDTNNKVQLLIEYKMMEQDWSAWTEDSYASGLYSLSDYEIEEFLNKSDYEIEQIKEQINKYYNENVKE